MISEAVERALAFTQKKELMVVGGVAANKRLSQMLKQVCRRQNCKFYVVPLHHSRMSVVHHVVSENRYLF